MTAPRGRRPPEPPPRPDRKERVLHTRVPEGLAEELRQLSDRMRVPVSNLVRTALEEAVGALSAVSRRTEGELRGLARRLGEPSEPGASAEPEELAPARAPLAGVVGFQRLVLARPTTCSLSGRELPTGAVAYLGIRDGEGPLVIIAPECLPASAETPAS